MRLRQYLLLLLALLLLLVGGVGYAAWQRTRWQPCGDPLLDALARATRDALSSESRNVQFSQLRDRIQQLSGLQLGSPPGDLSFRLSKIEQTYVDDPRYWEAAAALNMDSSIADRALAAGHFSPALLELASLWSLWDSDRGETQLLLDRAVAADPNNAYWYYRQAELRLDAGEDEAALKLLRQGRAAKDCYLPLSSIAVAALQLRGKTSDPRIHAIAGCWIYYCPVEIQIRRRRAFQNELSKLDQPGSIELAEELWLSANRQLRARDMSNLDLLVTHGNQGTLLQQSGRKTMRLSGPQLVEIEALLASRKRITALLKDVTQYDPPPLGGHPWGAPGSGYCALWDEWLYLEQRRPELWQLASELERAPHGAWARGELAGYVTPEAAAKGAAAAQLAEAELQKELDQREREREAERRK